MKLTKIQLEDYNLGELGRLNEYEIINFNDIMFQK